MVFFKNVPDLEIATLSAFLAFRDGYATPGQFDILLDVRDLLLFGAQHIKDEKIELFSYVVNSALRNVRDSWDGKTFKQLDENELNALSSLVDISRDFWCRHSGSLYQKAYTTLVNLREQQKAKFSGRKTNEDQRATD